jgi:DNA-directed RNA polymerase subunit E"
MAKEKACKKCKLIYEGDTCLNCGSTTVSDTFKGKVEIINPERSDIGNQLKVKKPGTYAIKL